MVRIIAFFAGLFFAAALLWSFAKGAYSAITDPAPATVESVYHLEPKALSLQSNGPFGTFNREQLQRGFQVYSEVCANCHALSYVAFRDLKQLGYNDDEVKAIAAKLKVPHYNPLTGDVTSKPGVPTDHFPPVVYAGQGSPPNLSLITKAREGGAAYVHSLITGYRPQPAALLKQFPDSKTPSGLYYNPYFANLNIAMPPPLVSDGQVSYKGRDQADDRPDGHRRRRVSGVDRRAQAGKAPPDRLARAWLPAVRDSAGIYGLPEHLVRQKTTRLYRHSAHAGLQGKIFCASVLTDIKSAPLRCSKLPPFGST